MTGATFARSDVVAVIREELERASETVDTAAIAASVVARIYDEDILRELAVKGTREIVGEEMRSSSTRSGSVVPNRSARWEQVRSVEERLREQTVPRTDGPPTFLLDATADDLADVVTYYRGRQAAFGRKAEAFAALEGRLRSAKADRVGDLDPDEVGRILNV